uniref:Uncharacterized protein n=1 Tax=Pseudictyota dubia TaxID=2749911 RepID=A0A7R9VH43_9STRA|mmetsp:Transcript_13225/g.24626  ORF Transcript_13225/g.24626 Transcript_13225/m.24626 type:complete len:273 (+) Transcript_13225:426-1244(+)
MPHALRSNSKHVCIHDGDKESLGGGNNGLLIHHGDGVRLSEDGILEETLIHEGVHASLDPLIIYNEREWSKWKEAADLDANYISLYARDYPETEDVSETFVMYLGVNYSPSRMTSDDIEIITKTIPHRIEYLSNLGLNMYPVVREGEKNLGPSLKKIGFRAVGKGACIDREGRNYDWGYFRYGRGRRFKTFERAAKNCVGLGKLVGVEMEWRKGKKYCTCLYENGSINNRRKFDKVGTGGARGTGPVVGTNGKGRASVCYKYTKKMTESSWQ